MRSLLSLLPLLPALVGASSRLDPLDLSLALPDLVETNLTRRASPPSCTNGFSLSSDKLSSDKLSCVCRSPKYTSADGVRCSTSCTSGTYILPGEDRRCATCPPPSAKCERADKPTGCVDGWFLYGNECRQTCPLGTWADDALGKNRCRACTDKDAAECKDAGATATGCLTKYLLNAVCIDASKVPDGFFADSTTHTVKSCDVGVRTCIGNGVGGATSCGKNKKNDQLVLTPKGTCALHCPSRYYADKRLAACIACDSASLTCDIQGARSCAKDSAGKQLFLTPTRNCLLPEAGPAGYWPDKATNTFKSCDEGVSSCVGNGAGTALTCGKRSDGTTLYYTSSSQTVPEVKVVRSSRRCDEVVLAGDCVEAAACPASTWADSASSTCTACDDEEEACSKNGQGSAVVCKRGLYLSVSKDCLTAEQCKASGAFYPDEDTRSCSTCHSGQAACTDNGLGFATACATSDNGDQLYLFDGNCVAATDCPAAYFADSDALSAATSCGVSDAGDQLFLQDGRCVVEAECDSSSWADLATRTCSSCKLIDEDAATCENPTFFTCSTKFFLPSSPSCIDECPARYFGDNYLCKDCSIVDLDSATCSSTAALTCRTKLLWQGQCVDECPIGYINLEGVCERCAVVYDDAATCDAEGALSCLTDNLLDSACVETCPEGYSTVLPTRVCKKCDDVDAVSCYASGPATACHRKCEQCATLYSGSATCDEQGALSCSASMFLSGTTCTSTCPDGTFPKPNGVCTPCPGGANVDTCAASGAATKCVPGTNLINGMCLTTCPETHLPVDGVCKPCSTFYGADAFTCSTTAILSCNSPKYFHQGACVSTCPLAGYFANAATRRCQPCGDVGALTCTATASLSCRSGFFLLNNVCRTSCPTTHYGYFGNCMPCAEWYPNSATCSTSEAISCVGGYLLNNAVRPSTCRPFAECQANSGNTRIAVNGVCAPCAAAFPNTASCNAGGAFSCAAGYRLEGRSCVA
ncbi:hypothetical protein JCM8547_002445 [Rhodosporidiobolus lusitaniae]